MPVFKRIVTVEILRIDCSAFDGGFYSSVDPSDVAINEPIGNISRLGIEIKSVQSDIFFDICSSGRFLGECGIVSGHFNISMQLVDERGRIEPHGRFFHASVGSGFLEEREVLFVCSWIRESLTVPRLNRSDFFL